MTALLAALTAWYKANLATLRLAAWVGSVGLVVAAYLYWRGNERKIGALEVRLASAESLATVLTKEASAIQTVYVHDTVRFTQNITHTDTVLTRLIDTLVARHTDTITVTKEVLVAADSTIRACRVIVSDCQHGWDTEKAISANLRAELKLTQSQVPSAFRSFVTKAVWALAGAEAGRISAGKVP